MAFLRLRALCASVVMICAKQTQFRTGGGWARLGGRGAWGLVQTNPIPALMPIRRSAFPGGQIVRNKANLLRGGGRPSPRPPALTMPPGGRSRGPILQNEPNFRPSGRPRDLEQTIASGARQPVTVCRPQPTGPATGQSRCLGCRRGVDSPSVPADADGPMNTNE